MTELPCGSGALVVRTDFSSDAAWEDLRLALSSPSEDGFLAYVELVADRQFTGVTAEEALSLLPVGYGHPLLVLADAMALASEEHPLLVMDLREERGRCIRVVARELWGIENNLSISNMDFKEFAVAIDADGVFRGF
ncbi:hypothetical protein ADL01_27705 [Streptomyces sp. NRRL WC-3618]|uniref:DUF6924 domain-containing protein n=1 Tax=Streptomyces sp. NRRL WC-3618 TaxID=1519490 RepID=UPI0006ADEAFF|nr:hypothetical protein [Streptomyces sp. NRRL WC-3618]KOV64792.1 hypothetical protein ADL01_27705 [Streptomyces sp. NRRL WC-3618]